MDEAIDLLGISMKVSSSLVVFGRSLKLDDSNRSMIAFLYASSAYLFISAGWLHVRKRYFSVGFLMTASIAAALMVDPFLYAAIFVEIAVLGGVLLLEYQGSRNSSPKILESVYVLAMIAILMAGWTLDVGGVTAGSIELAFITKLFLGFGIVVLLGLPPFSVWLLKATQETEPAEWTFVASLLQVAGLFFLLTFLTHYGFLRDDPLTTYALKIGGMVFLWFGSIIGIFQTKIGRFIAYAITADLGFMLLVVSGLDEDAFMYALVATSSRVVAMGLISTGLTQLEDSGVEHSNTGALPLLLLAAGMLSLSGFPLLSGFPARWGAIHSNLGGDASATTTVFVSIVLLSLTSFRWMFRLIDRAGWPVFRPDWKKSWPYLLMLILCLMIGIIPQVLLVWQLDVINGLNMLPG
ncbi:MAG: hypothetical protein JXA25_07550 [Anaerolineales bacterium]|nr:hypothetical protein [Anaerolineales bacterium]